VINSTLKFREQEKEPKKQGKFNEIKKLWNSKKLKRKEKKK
jgi:hypothetical protein